MTAYHFQSAMILMRNFDGKNTAITRWFGKDVRTFHVVVPKEDVRPMKDAGWNVQYSEKSDLWYLLVKIDADYDQDLTPLVEGAFNYAEVFIEGRQYYTNYREGLAAFLISITPQQ